MYYCISQKCRVFLYTFDQIVMADDADYAIVQIFDPWDILVPAEQVAKLSYFEVATRQVTSNDLCTEQKCLLNSNGTKVDGRHLWAQVIETEILTEEQAQARIAED